MKIEITLKNPWSGEYVTEDITNITSDDIECYHLDFERAERELDASSYESAANWLAAYVDLVGAEEAGEQIIGS